MIYIAQDGLALLENEIESIEGALMNGLIAVVSNVLGDRKKWREMTFQTTQSIQNLPYVVELRPVYGSIINAYRDVKNVDEAIRWCQILEKRAKDIHDLIGQVSAINLRGNMWFAKGDIYNALSLLRQSLELVTSTGDPKMRMECLRTIGEYFLRLGCPKQAEVNIQLSREITELGGFKDDLALANISLGLLSLCQHNWKQANELFQKALLLGQEIERPWEQWWSIYFLARTYQATGDRIEAALRFQKVVEFLGVRHLYTLETALNLVVALCGLEETSSNPEAFRAITRRHRQEHTEMDQTSFSHWFLEEADARSLPASILQDTFTTELTSDWDWCDHFNDCTFKVQDGLVIHAANGRDLSSLNLSAPRVLRTLTSNTFDNLDFAIQTICMIALNDRPTIGGLLLWVDEENYLRLDRGHSASTKLCLWVAWIM